MSTQPRGGQRKRDLLDRIPGTDDEGSALERAIGPSCLLSFVIVLLMLVAFRRLLAVPPPILALIVFFVWIGVLIVLVRAKPLRFLDEEEFPD